MNILTVFFLLIAIVAFALSFILPDGQFTIAGRGFPLRTFAYLMGLLAAVDIAYYLVKRIK